MAYCFFQREDDTQVIKMLDPLFVGEATSVGRHHEVLLDLLSAIPTIATTKLIRRSAICCNACANTTTR